MPSSAPAACADSSRTFFRRSPTAVSGRWSSRFSRSASFRARRRRWNPIATPARSCWSCRSGAANLSDLFFLPSLPYAAEALPWYALLLLVAAIAGELVLRWLHLPRLFGWIATGVLLGPQVSGVLTEGVLDEMRGVLDVAIGVVLFQLGQRVDLGWLRRNPSLLATSVLEASLAFA